jgi:hypothetical protein
MFKLPIILPVDVMDIHAGLVHFRIPPIFVAEIKIVPDAKMLPNRFVPVPIETEPPQIIVEPLDISPAVTITVPVD